jgi:hypothetical protein
MQNQKESEKAARCRTRNAKAKRHMVDRRSDQEAHGEERGAGGMDRGAARMKDRFYPKRRRERNEGGLVAYQS